MIKLKEYFRFNSRERLAIILLICLMTIFGILPEYYPSKPLPALMDGQIKNVSKPLEFVQRDSVKENAIPSNGDFRKSEKLVAVKPITYFYFDPNTIDAKQWQSLGLRDKTVQTILNYRNKGGLFKRGEDLRKIWGLKPEEAEKLIPYVQIAVVLQKTRKDRDFKTTAFVDSMKLQKPAILKKLNINTATEEEWRVFPGIGLGLSARIIKFRDKIGGFKSLAQVGKTYGIPDSVFQRMLPFLEMGGDTAIKK